MSSLLIQFSNLFKSFGSLKLFEDISLSICEKDIFAIIGENGSGKTTILQLILGNVLPDSGQIFKAKKLRIGFLPQEITIEEGSVRAYLEKKELSDLELQMNEALEKGQLTEWENLHEKYQDLGGYRKIPVEKVYQGLKIEKLLDMQMQNLSSGERVRIALAKALIDNPDLLLLDEPTNHLDEEMLVFLQRILQSRRATIIISHDRKFINSVANNLIEIKNQKLTSFSGNYDFYLSEQKRLIEKEIKAYEMWEEEKNELKKKIKALSFSTKKPPPPKDRNIMAYDKRGEFHQKSLHRNLSVLKNKLEEFEKNPPINPKSKSIKGLRFIYDEKYHVAIEIKEISKVFGEKKLFSNFNKTLFYGDKIILTGANGSGKTTLLKAIMGLVKLDKGEIFISPNVKIGYLDQDVNFPMENTPKEYFEKHFNLSKEALLSEMHKAALFGSDIVDKPFSFLSVGQRKRLKLLELVLQRPNVLLLDEPTNHLDLLTLEALEESLLNFKGAILAVSHDKTFIEKIASEKWSL